MIIQTISHYRIPEKPGEGGMSQISPRTLFASGWRFEDPTKRAPACNTNLLVWKSKFSDVVSFGLFAVFLQRDISITPYNIERKQVTGARNRLQMSRYNMTYAA